MSCVVLVRQFLSRDAANEFNTIFQWHHVLVSKAAGFVSLRCLKTNAPGHDDELVLVLEFKSEADLRTWRASAEHAAVAERYRRLWARDPETEFFIAEEEKKRED